MVLLDRMAFVLFVLLKTEDNMAQTPPLTTYYVIQPTLGCNGMWAFGPASEMWGCAPPYTYG